MLKKLWEAGEYRYTHSIKLMNIFVIGHRQLRFPVSLLHFRLKVFTAHRGQRHVGFGTCSDSRVIQTSSGGCRETGRM